MPNQPSDIPNISVPDFCWSWDQSTALQFGDGCRQCHQFVGQNFIDRLRDHDRASHPLKNGVVQPQRNWLSGVRRKVGNIDFDFLARNIRGPRICFNAHHPLGHIDQGVSLGWPRLLDSDLQAKAFADVFNETVFDFFHACRGKIFAPHKIKILAKPF